MKELLLLFHGTAENSEEAPNTIITQVDHALSKQGHRPFQVMKGPGTLGDAATWSGCAHRAIGLAHGTSDMETNKNLATDEIIRQLRETDPNETLSLKLVGFSRGAITAIKVINALKDLKPKRNIDLQFFLIDPVPGHGGNWTPENIRMMALPKHITVKESFYSLAEREDRWNFLSAQPRMPADWPVFITTFPGYHSSAVYEYAKEAFGTFNASKESPSEYYSLPRIYRELMCRFCDIDNPATTNGFTSAPSLLDEYAKLTIYLADPKAVIPHFSGEKSFVMYGGTTDRGLSGTARHLHHENPTAFVDGIHQALFEKAYPKLATLLAPGRKAILAGYLEGTREDPAIQAELIALHKSAEQTAWLASVYDRLPQQEKVEEEILLGGSYGMLGDSGGESSSTPEAIFLATLKTLDISKQQLIYKKINLCLMKRYNTPEEKHAALFNKMFELYKGTTTKQAYSVPNTVVDHVEGYLLQVGYLKNHTPAHQRAQLLDKLYFSYLEAEMDVINDLTHLVQKSDLINTLLAEHTVTASIFAVKELRNINALFGDVTEKLNKIQKHSQGIDSKIQTLLLQSFAQMRDIFRKFEYTLHVLETDEKAQLSAEGLHYLFDVLKILRDLVPGNDALHNNYRQRVDDLCTHVLMRQWRVASAPADHVYNIVLPQPPVVKGETEAPAGSEALEPESAEDTQSKASSGELSEDESQSVGPDHTAVSNQSGKDCTTTIVPSLPDLTPTAADQFFGGLFGLFMGLATTPFLLPAFWTREYYVQQDQNTAGEKKNYHDAATAGIGVMSVLAGAATIGFSLIIGAIRGAYEGGTHGFSKLSHYPDAFWPAAKSVAPAGAVVAPAKDDARENDLSMVKDDGEQATPPSVEKDTAFRLLPKLRAG